MKAYFVIFYSPGTLVAEQSKREIDSWDIAKAVEMAKDIRERYSATPYGFRFTTRERKDNELDSKQVAASNMYFLGGTVFTLEEIKARNDPDDRILISNMEGNRWDRVIENCNSWKVVRPLREGDVVLDFAPPLKENLCKNTSPTT